MPVVTDYTALLSGSYWNGIEVTGAPVIVTYSFPTALPAYDASVGGFTPSTLTSFSAFTSAEQTQARQALGEWAAASGLIFLQVAPGQGDINFSNVDFNTTSNPSYAGAGGIGFYPFGDWSYLSYPNFSGDLDSSGDIFMNSQYQNADGTVAYGTLLHEIGHAIGLKHPTQVVTDFAATTPVVHDQVLAADDPTQTIMATVGDTSSSTTPHLLPLDQQAAAFIYGAAGTGGVYTASASGTDSISNWVWDAATQTLTQTAVTSGETIRGSSVNDIIHAVSGDNRLFGLSGTNTLYAGSGNDSLYGGTGINTLVGGTGNDSFYVFSTTTTIVAPSNGGFDSVYSTVSFTLPANVQSLSLFGAGLTGTANNQGDSLFGDGTFATTLIGGTGDDYIVGGAGNDTIAGGGGTNVMYGGLGADTFVFRATTDALPGQNLTSIGDFSHADGDKIDLSGITILGGQPLHFIATSVFSDTAGEVRQTTINGNEAIEGDVNGDGVADFQIGIFTTAGPVVFQASDFAFTSPACFRIGTRILTEKGEIAVENLTAGDRVVTAAGTFRPVRWIGHRRIDCRSHPRPKAVWPIRIRTGAFGDNIPYRELFLSPDHAVFVEGVLIPIKLLMNGGSIAPVPVDAVTYFHVELDSHDVLLAEGLTAESYLDTGNRSLFANGDGVMELYPLMTWHDNAAAPLATGAARVEPVWERLAARSRALGWALPRARLTRDPAVRLMAGGRAIRPVAVLRDRLTFVLPRTGHDVRIVSRAGHPTDVRPFLGDDRRLGVCVHRIVWHEDNLPRALAMDHPALRDGWWQPEFDGPVMRRWTNGDAILPVPREARMIEIYLSGTMDYDIDTKNSPARFGVTDEAAPISMPPLRQAAS